MLALADYEAKVCPDCGLHHSVADSDPDFTIEDRTCPVGAAVERYLRERAEAEQKAEKDLPASSQHAADGRTTYVRLLRPDELKTEAKE